MYKVTYGSSYFSYHVNLIHRIKKCAVQTLFRPGLTVRQELELWMKTRLAETEKSILNFDKKLEVVEEKMEKIESTIWGILQGVTESELETTIQKIVPVTKVVKQLPIKDYFKIPIPYEITLEDTLLFAWGLQSQFNDPRFIELKARFISSFEDKQKRIQKKEFNSEDLRRCTLQGLGNYKHHILNLASYMKSVDQTRPESFEFTLRGDRESAQFECKDWPEGFKGTSINLCKRQHQPGRYYFEPIMNYSVMR